MTFVGESDGKRRHEASRSYGLRSVPGTVGSVARDADKVVAVLDRRTWAADPTHNVVACVDVQPSAPGSAGAVTANVLSDLALRRVQRCIRPADRVCMIGGHRFVVCFGNGAHRISPGDLGARLARAMGNHLVVGKTALSLTVRVGVGSGTLAVDPKDLAGAAIASTHSSRRRAITRRARRTTPSVVAVTHVPNPDEILRVSGSRNVTEGDRTQTLPHALGAPGPGTVHRLQRRTLFSPVEATEHNDAVIGTRAAAAPVADALKDPALTRVAGLTILVVDPAVATSDMPRSAVQGVAAVARRLGACPILSPGDRVDLVVDVLSVSEADAVVLILHPDTARIPWVADTGTPWEHPARLTRALVDVGAPVIALSVGASAAGVAACVEQGAVGLLQIDALADELATLVPGSSPKPPIRTNGNGSTGTPRVRRQLPAPFDALVNLTSTERKVLFHMMEGRSAGDIAAVLVVSLTTVRSHIRSILRKLNVNSQLAAVAIANGADPRSCETV